MKISMMRHCTGEAYHVIIMAVSGKWAMVRRKGAMPFCVMVKELEVNTTTGIEATPTNSAGREGCEK